MSYRKDHEATAEKYARRGKYKDAIKEYQKLLTGGEEQDITIRNILGDLYIKANLVERAAEEFLRIAQYYEQKNIYAKSIALYKRITRLKPELLEYAEKLADLLRGQGFLSESKTEYLLLADKYSQDDRPKDAIKVYHKLLELDREDIESRLALADLYENEGKIEQTIEELNELAEIKMAGEKYEEAKPLLDRARDLQEDHSRTLSNLIDLLSIEKKDEEALSLVKNVLEKDKENFKALKIYGNLLYAKKDFKSAEEIFTKILSLRPGEINARVKLGKIYILEEKIDEAFTLFDPIVDSFLQKKKEDKAISLLGLITGTKIIHLPTLEKMAKIYSESGQKKNFEIVSKILLSEFKKNNQKNNILDILNSLVQMFPEEGTYYNELKYLNQTLGLSDKEKDIDESFELREKAEEMIESNLIKADLYIEQGLVRNAKRILNNLVINFPDDSWIKQKIAELKSVYPDFGLDEIPDRVEKVAEKESLLFSEGSKTVFRDSLQHGKPVKQEDTVSVADIFADTDIIPFSAPEGETSAYFDLAERIDEELIVMQDILALQKEKGISTFEKPLSEIIEDFKKDIGLKMMEANSESRYNLGLAFLEQGLWDEAIEEIKLASQDASLAIDCYLVMSVCYRKKQDYNEALIWVEKALQIAGEGSSQFFSLKYELASIYEELGDSLKAMQVFLDVKKWESDYRDVNKRLKDLAKTIN
ncbi:MAG: tetratricopeptide repeat protein [Candidatus Aminicenantes bacterium]|nr:tetratricopeptide repeat protein [Candidatus Aminicenantes bacterium]